MKRVVFLGTPELAATVLTELAASQKYKVTLVVSQPDRPQGRKRKIVPTPVHAKADELGIPVFQPETAKDEAFYERIAAEEPDFLVTAAYGQILTPEVLALAKIEALNVHASLLPKYRGASPVQWSIINGDAQTGVSIMRMVKALDAGPVFATATLDILPNETTDELMERLAVAGAKLLLPTMDKIVEGLQPVEQDEREATYVGMLCRDTGAIDWTKSARQIHNLVRGTYGWPCASTFLGNSSVKIHCTAIPEDQEDVLTRVDSAILEQAEPGMILDCNGGRMLVACGPDTGSTAPCTVLEILELQMAGGKRLTADTCAHNFKAGTMLGETHD